MEREREEKGKKKWWILIILLLMIGSCTYGVFVWERGTNEGAGSEVNNNERPNIPERPIVPEEEVREVRIRYEANGAIIARISEECRIEEGEEGCEVETPLITREGWEQVRWSKNR